MCSASTSTIRYTDLRGAHESGTGTSALSLNGDHLCKFIRVLPMSRNSLAGMAYFSEVMGPTVLFPKLSSSLVSFTNTKEARKQRNKSVCVCVCVCVGLFPYICPMPSKQTTLACIMQVFPLAASSGLSCSYSYSDIILRWQLLPTVGPQLHGTIPWMDGLGWVNSCSRNVP